MKTQSKLLIATMLALLPVAAFAATNSSTPQAGMMMCPCGMCGMMPQDGSQTSMMMNYDWQKDMKAMQEQMAQMHEQMRQSQRNY